MKRIFVILVAAVLFATTIFGYGIAQSRVDPRMIDLERKTLEDRLERHNNNPRLTGQTKENLIERVKRDMAELDRDPDLYFYKRQGGTASSPRVGVGVNPTTGETSPVVRIR